MQIQTIYRLLCLSSLPIVLAGCISQGEIATLNARMNEQERRMRTLSSQVGSVEQVLPGQAEMWAQMQAMRQELNLVRGQLDEMNAGGGGPSMQITQIKASHDRLEAAVRQMAAQLGISLDVLNAPPAVGSPLTGMPEPVAPPPAAPAPQQPVVQPDTPKQQPASPAPRSSDTATNLYNAGMNAFSSGKYANAVKAFTDFTKAFPNDKQASNAQFWRGESYYQLKDYAGAALAYQQVLEKHPGSAKFQSAMLKQGMAFYYAGKKDAARLRLNELIQKYPSSPEAGRAKTFLQKNK